MKRIHIFIILALLAMLITVSFFLFDCVRSHFCPPPQVAVLVDAGHPSLGNSGRTVQHGTTELETNWLVAGKLEEILSQDPRIKVVRTREDMDEVVSNYDRARIGNEANAALAVHLHCDAGPNHGFTVYYPDNQVTRFGMKRPSKQVLLNSKKAAVVVHEGMSAVLDGHLKNRGIKGETFTYVGRNHGALSTSIYSTVPTITVEMVFLSNRHDAEFIKSEIGQDLMAEALADGILDFIQPRLDNLDARAARGEREQNGR